MSVELTGSAARPITVDADGATLAGLLAEPPGQPRALVLALHGSGITAQYFDCRTAPGLSLLELGAGCGYTVLALDRPGHGGSARVGPVSGEAQAELLLTALERFAETHATGAGAFVVSHSAGAKVAFNMAADAERGSQLLGIESSGTGIEFAPAFVASRAAGEHYSLLAWGSDDLYPPGTGDALVRVRTSPADMSDGRSWPDRIRALAGEIVSPVHITLGEQERFYPTEPAARDEFAALFVNAPLVEVGVERHSGHNLSVGWSARAYHLRVLAFVERCILLRRFGTITDCSPNRLEPAWPSSVPPTTSA